MLVMLSTFCAFVLSLHTHGVIVILNRTCQFLCPFHFIIFVCHLLLFCFGQFQQSNNPQSIHIVSFSALCPGLETDCFLVYFIFFLFNPGTFQAGIFNWAMANLFAFFPFIIHGFIPQLTQCELVIIASLWKHQ